MLSILRPRNECFQIVLVFVLFFYEFFTILKLVNYSARFYMIFYEILFIFTLINSVYQQRLRYFGMICVYGLGSVVYSFCHYNYFNLDFISMHYMFTSMLFTTLYRAIEKYMNINYTRKMYIQNRKNSGVNEKLTDSSRESDDNNYGSPITFV